MPAAANLAVAFEPVPIDIAVGNHVVTIPALPACVWLPILTDPGTDGLDIFPGLLDDAGQDVVDRLIFDGKLDTDELKEIIYGIITEASGHDWWWSLNLLSVLRGPSSTQVLGEMAKVDATTASLAGWLNALYAILVQHLKAEQKMRLDGELEMPPPGVDVQISEADQLATQQAFFGMMRQSNG